MKTGPSVVRRARLAREANDDGFDASYMSDEEDDLA